MSQELGFDGHFVMYSARYSSGARALRMGVDIRALQGAYMHSSVTTTLRYVPRIVDSTICEVL